MTQYHVTASHSTGKHRHHLVEASDNAEAVGIILNRHDYPNGQTQGWTLIARRWSGKKLPKATIMEEPA